mmetsp:Transcript_7926/g.15388  ORF Transcript_7926/g.15388 Transcript_7926/m.15388 type:complete len:152 (+) Transcript_7926:2272-2727(+)
MSVLYDSFDESKPRSFSVNRCKLPQLHEITNGLRVHRTVDLSDVRMTTLRRLKRGLSPHGWNTNATEKDISLPSPPRYKPKERNSFNSVFPSRISSIYSVGKQIAQQRTLGDVAKLEEEAPVREFNFRFDKFVEYREAMMLLKTKGFKPRS